MSNAALMTLNQDRRELGLRCLPFIKQMDRYLTFYVYTTKDVSESDKIKAKDKTDIILNDGIISILEHDHNDAEIKYVPVEYSGFIELED